MEGATAPELVRSASRDKEQEAALVSALVELVRLSRSGATRRIASATRGLVAGEGGGDGQRRDGSERGASTSTAEGVREDWWVEWAAAAVRTVYRGVTTGLGEQTLGEEFCDVVQTDMDGVPVPRPAKRLASILLHGFGPVILARMATAARGTTQAGGTTESRQREDGLAVRALRAVSRGLLPLLPLLMKMHLIAFYFNADVFDPVFRLVGVRHVYAGPKDSNAVGGRNVSYQVLGMMLAAQVAITTAMQFSGGAGVARTIASERDERMARPSSTLSSMITVLDNNLKLVQSPDADATKGGGDVGSQVRNASVTESEGIDSLGLTAFIHGSEDRSKSADIKCPLCLSQSPLRFPTCTPCGHVFCWECVAEWCEEKQECALCRQKVLPSDLVSLNHVDF